MTNNLKAEFFSKKDSYGGGGGFLCEESIARIPEP
jgi:hypothetical protein